MEKLSGGILILVSDTGNVWLGVLMVVVVVMVVLTFNRHDCQTN